MPRSAAKFVSALVPRTVNSSGGSGFTTPGSPPAARAGAASEANGTAAEAAATSFSSSRRSIPGRIPPLATGPLPRPHIRS
ncbi:hypothetical protein SCALM49S_08166 [Streptomyces californicus]